MRSNFLALVTRRAAAFYVRFRVGGAVIAKFHYTDPTGPDRTGPDQTKSVDFAWHWLNSITRARPDPTGPVRTRTTRISEKLRWSVRVSDKVRAGPCGSGRARVVEYSLNQQTAAGRRADLIRRLRQSDHTRHPITLQAACCRECHAVSVAVAGRRAKCIHAISYCVQSSRPYLISLSLRRTFIPNRSRPRCPVYDAFRPNMHGRATDNTRVCGPTGL